MGIDLVTIGRPVHGAPAEIAGEYRVRLKDGTLLTHPIRRDKRIALLKHVVEVLFTPRPVDEGEEE